MLLHTMTIEEMHREMNKDVPWIDTKFVKLLALHNRKFKKRKNVNYKKFFWAKSPYTGNRWLLLSFCIHSCPYYASFTTFESPQGLTLLHHLDEKDYVYKFSPHFLTRYKERLRLKVSTSRELIETFVLANNYYYHMPQSSNDAKLERAEELPYNILLIMEQGLGLGVCYPKDKLMMVKTFVSNSMIHNQQWKLRQDVVRVIKAKVERLRYIKKSEGMLYHYEQSLKLLTQLGRKVKKKVS
jgi:hypothetical protein